MDRRYERGSRYRGVPGVRYRVYRTLDRLAECPARRDGCHGEWSSGPHYRWMWLGRLAGWLRPRSEAFRRWSTASLAPEPLQQWERDLLQS